MDTPYQRPYPHPATPEPPSQPEFERLDPAVIRLWRVSASIGLLLAGLLALVPLGFMLPGAGRYALAAAALVLAVAWIIWWPPARYRSWSFLMGEGKMVARHGVFWRTVSVIPYTRIQHVDTQRGPLERGFGLATLVVFTAGTQGASVPVPGLASARAERMRDRLAELGGYDDAV
ncbi:MAG: PH domain-containing protein [Longimicrobiaceae bacterium]